MSRKNMLPEGTRDLFLEECVIKRWLQRNIDDSFSKWGYEEVITPTLEFYETFNCYPENLKEEDMYKFFDNRGRILVLRPDMTIPIARLIATKLKDETLPIRLRYTSNVFRVHESFVGKRNEYTDCGVELIGIEEGKADLEILVLALESLKKLGLNDFKLEIGNIEFFNSAFRDLDINHIDKQKIAQLIENKNLKNLKDFLEEIDMEEEYRRFFNKLPWMFGDKKVLEEGKRLAFNDELVKNIEYLEQLYVQLENLGYEKNITFDLGMIPRLNYYTGIIFRGYGEGIGDSILTGGRYDNLIKSYGMDLPAVGFSIDIDAVIHLIKDSKIIGFNKEKYKLFYGKGNVVEAIIESQKLRGEGKSVQLSYDDDLDEIKVVKYGGL